MSLYDDRKRIKKQTKEFEWDITEKLGLLKVRYQKFLQLDYHYEVKFTSNNVRIGDDKTLNKVGLNPIDINLNIFLENDEGMISFKIKQMRIKKD